MVPSPSFVVIKLQFCLYKKDIEKCSFEPKDFSLQASLPFHPTESAKKKKNLWADTAALMLDMRRILFNLLLQFLLMFLGIF